MLTFRRGTFAIERERAGVLRTSAPDAEDIGRVDGRVLRGIRTRLALVTAARELFLSGAREPTLDDIVRRAGVSPRIAMKYFNGLGGLIAAMVVQVLDEVVTRFESVRADASLDDRISAYVQMRAEVCEQFAPLWLRALQMARHTPEIHRLVERGRVDVRNFAARVFARELHGLPQALRRDLFDELAMISDWHNCTTGATCARPAIVRRNRPGSC
jgi:AcrR family transcriptional regulator